MENASKALIIAGAILLSILIIGLGMFIYNQAADAVGKTGIDEQKVKSYNSSFEQYEGVISGTSARTLCDVIRAHNNSHQDDASLNVKVTVLETGNQDPETTAQTGIITAAKVNDEKSKIKAGIQYKVAFGYDTKTGYIVDCVITKQ